MNNPAVLKTIDLDIEGMTCTACARRIEKNLNKLEGVSAYVDFASEKAHVTYVGELPREQLVSAVVDSGYGVGTSRNELSTLVLRLWIGGLLSLPLAIVSMVPQLMPANWSVLSGALALPVAAWVAWPFHRAAIKNLRKLTSTMDTLVSLGVAIAFGYSAWQLISGGSESYFEVSAVVPTVVLFGRWLEVRTRRSATDSVRALLAAIPSTATVRRGSSQMTLATNLVLVGDLVVVATGEKLPVDGLIVEGSGQLDNSLITGEALAKDVEVGDSVAAGALNVGPSLVVSATAISANSRIAQIADLVREATSQKAKINSLTDRVSEWFVPSVIVIALATFVVRTLTGLEPQSALSAAIAVLVIACPCALGIAVPMSLAVATAIGAKRGIVIRNPDILRRLGKVRQVVFDKTGTLTTGRLTASRFVPLAGFDQKKAIALAAALERNSAHPIAKALAALDVGFVAENVVEQAGFGVSGVVKFGGDLEPVVEAKVSRCIAEAFSNADEVRQALQSIGPVTTVAVSVGDKAVLIIVFDDMVRVESATAIAELRRLKVEPILLSGDSAGRVAAVASELAIEKFYGEVTPERKYEVVQGIKNNTDSGLTMMVGDGINDVAALAAADVGLAMGSGTYAAQAAAAITVVDDDPLCIPFAVRLGRATWRNIVQNLVWAFGYNVVLIPVAAFGLLNPMLAGTAMAFSSVSVVVNSLRLKQTRTL